MVAREENKGFQGEIAAKIYGGSAVSLGAAYCNDCRGEKRESRSRFSAQSHGELHVNSNVENIWPPLVIEFHGRDRTRESGEVGNN